LEPTILQKCIYAPEFLCGEDNPFASQKCVECFKRKEWLSKYNEAIELELDYFSFS